MSHVSIISTKIIDQDEDNINEEQSHVNDLCLVIMVHCLTNVEIRETCIDYESTIYQNLMDLTNDDLHMIKYKFRSLNHIVTNLHFSIHI